MTYRPIRVSDPLGKQGKGLYMVETVEPRVVRPTRVAAGMTYTNHRSQKYRCSRDALMLMVDGTLDKLVKGLQYKVVKGDCPHCGARTGKLVITERGRLRLRVMRNRAQARRKKS